MYVLIYTTALRGSNVALLIVISHLVDLVEFGKISAVYVFVMSGAQIIGLPLIALALRSSGGTAQDRVQDSIFWWAAITLITVAVYIIFGHSLSGMLFSEKIDNVMLAVGCFWMCAMGLEILSGALAAASGKLRTMAAGSVLQAAATLFIVPVGILVFGMVGLLLVPFCGLIAGGIMVARIIEWRTLRISLRDWRRGAIGQLIGTMGPAGIAAISVTVLNMALVSITAASAKAYLDLAIFAIALQLVGVSTFVPQVLSNSALESGHRAARNGQRWRTTLTIWAGVSLALSATIGIAIGTFGASFAILYADGYTFTPSLLAAAGILISLVGPVNVLSHVLIIGGRQWLSATICLVSTILVIGGFVIQPSRSSEAMLWAVAGSNALRLLALSAFAFLDVRQHESMERTSGKAARKC